MSDLDLSMHEMSYSEAINGCIDIYETDPTLAIMLWGRAGVGKSTIGKALVEHFNYDRLVDIRLPLHDPTDLKGLPVPNREKNVVDWFPMGVLPKPGERCVVILDEIVSAPQLIQVGAYQITLDRACGDYVLPPETIVLAAGNPEGTGVCMGMPEPLISRFASHMYIRADFEEWKTWAFGAGIDPRIIGFLSQYKNMLQTKTPKSGNVAYACPRSWHLLSRWLKGKDLDGREKLIAGAVGLEAGSLFAAHAKYHHKMPNIDDILAGKPFKYPEEAEVIYQTISAVIAGAREGDFDKVMPNLLKFAVNMPSEMEEYAIVVAQDIYKVFSDKFRSHIIKMAEFSEFSKRFKSLILG